MNEWPKSLKPGIVPSVNALRKYQNFQSTATRQSRVVTESSNSALTHVLDLTITKHGLKRERFLPRVKCWWMIGYTDE